MASLSCPKQLCVRYNSSVMTQKLVVIVVLNDSNNNHKQSRFFVDFVVVDAQHGINWCCAYI